MDHVNPFFKVEKVPVQTIMGNTIRNKYALVNCENGETLGLVDRKYKLVTNRQIADLFYEFTNRYDVNVVKDFVDSIGKRWKRWVVFKGDNKIYNIDGRNDTINIMIEIFNSYTGKSSFGYEIMAYRSYCNNGCVFGKRSLLKVNYHHFHGNPDKLMLDFDSRMNVCHDNINIWRSWVGKKITINDFYKFAEKKVNERLLTKIISKWKTELGNDTNMWYAYNMITAMATHETKARKGSHIFSNGYKNLIELAENFHNIKIETIKPVVVPEQLTT